MLTKLGKVTSYVSVRVLEPAELAVLYFSAAPLWHPTALSDLPPSSLGVLQAAAGRHWWRVPAAWCCDKCQLGDVLSWALPVAALVVHALSVFGPREPKDNHTGPGHAKGHELSWQFCLLPKNGDFRSIPFFPSDLGITSYELLITTNLTTARFSAQSLRPKLFKAFTCLPVLHGSHNFMELFVYVYI